ncbi:hypothetical protein P43SY_012111 [Pythium insidiosum]|uniref:Uncharacterized protein n=1 Tax=Pythium insidiosum TaxID=114742 RepID=A0AAD5Q641_PYTIN|nr:hypothetical protein P43SY_012111 [Pythium insidiosum]
MGNTATPNATVVVGQASGRSNSRSNSSSNSSSNSFDPTAAGARSLQARQEPLQQQRQGNQLELDAMAQSSRRATFAAFIGFGLASWIMTNASYIELGVFLRVLPEQYGIFAYSIFALQSANIYPLLYMLLNGREQRVRHATAIWVLLAIGIVTAMLMSVLWKETAMVFGKPHSVAMLVLTHLGGLVSATSSVVFYPYVGTFPGMYTSALSTGEGLSGSMAAMLGLIQRPYDAEAMRFSVFVFYILCAGIMVISLASFAFLELHEWPRRARFLPDVGRAADDKATQRVDQACEVVPLVPERTIHDDDAMHTEEAGVSSTSSEFRVVAPYLVCQLLLAAFSHVRVYRVRESTVVLLAVACTLLAFSLHNRPWLATDIDGYVLPLTLHISYLVFYAYTQTMIYLTLKRLSETASLIGVVHPHRVYQWSGFATQIGAFKGTMIVFPLVFFNESLFLRAST